MNLEYIIPPIERKLIEAELNDDTFVRLTNKGNNELYVVNQHNGPNTLLEIGRLRELTFAMAGGGTGKEIDLDEYDTSENCYQQLIVWTPESKEIIGGYRFKNCALLTLKDEYELSTQHYFNFSDKFIAEYLPFTVELGRSWVQPSFQPTVNPRKGIFALDNLWDGLGAITIDYPNTKHFFGKVTMYSSYDQEARDAVLAFMEYFFEDKERLVKPKRPLEITTDQTNLLKAINNLDFKSALRELNRFIQGRGETIPPLINNYMQLSPTMKAFGTAANPDFGDVEETGIMITIADIYQKKKDRHVKTYQPKKKVKEV